MNSLVEIAKALSDPHRLRALAALRRGELCVCRIIALLGLAPSTVSKHMSVLKHAGLVESRKEERWIYYKLPESRPGDGVVREGIDWVFRSLLKDSAIIQDEASLRRILRQSPEALCRDRSAKEKKTS